MSKLGSCSYVVKPQAHVARRAPKEVRTPGKEVVKKVCNSWLSVTQAVDLDPQHNSWCTSEMDRQQDLACW